MGNSQPTTPTYRLSPKGVRSQTKNPSKSGSVIKQKKSVIHELRSGRQPNKEQSKTMRANKTSISLSKVNQVAKDQQSDPKQKRKEFVRVNKATEAVAFVAKDLNGTVKCRKISPSSSKSNPSYGFDDNIDVVEIGTSGGEQKALLVEKKNNNNKKPKENISAEININSNKMLLESDMTQNDNNINKKSQSIISKCSSPFSNVLKFDDPKAGNSSSVESICELDGCDGGKINGELDADKEQRPSADEHDDVGRVEHNLIMKDDGGFVSDVCAVDKARCAAAGGAGAGVVNNLSGVKAASGLISLIQRQPKTNVKRAKPPTTLNRSSSVYAHMASWCSPQAQSSNIISTNNKNNNYNNNNTINNSFAVRTMMLQLCAGTAKTNFETTAMLKSSSPTSSIGALQLAHLVEEKARQRVRSWINSQPFGLEARSRSQTPPTFSSYYPTQTEVSIVRAPKVDIFLAYFTTS